MSHGTVECTDRETWTFIKVEAGCSDSDMDINDDNPRIDEDYY